MDTVTLLLLLTQIVRTIVFAAVIILSVGFLLSWLVRTRRINPFHPVARGIRNLTDPLLAPVERRIVGAGGLPSAAPFWGIAGAVVLGIIIVSGFNFVAGTIGTLLLAAASGPAGLFFVLVRATFGILKLAIIIVVVVSWLPISPFSSWVRWAFTITEPIMRPLRQIVPKFGMFDITPIAAYFALNILEWAFLRL
ncbi:MAG: YggT family protein [Gemmatimonadaceae bacterium]